MNTSPEVSSKEFWEGVPPKMIPKCLSNNDYDIIGNEEE